MTPEPIMGFVIPSNSDIVCNSRAKLLDGQLLTIDIYADR